MKTAQLTVNIGNLRLSAFLQGGFFHTSPGNTWVHKHRYTEIHVVSGGDCCYLVGNRHITVLSGQALAIPANTFHACTSATPQAKNTAFQITFPLQASLRIPLPCNSAAHLIQQIEETASPGKIATTIGLICAELFDPPMDLKPLRDPAFVIHESLENQYAADLTLEDLSSSLGLSKKQTERLIFRHTGSTLRKEIVRRRMEVARHLLETGTFSLAQVAERVGYKSYSGFWKAFKNRQEEISDKPR